MEASLLTSSCSSCARKREKDVSPISVLEDQDKIGRAAGAALGGSLAGPATVAGTSACIAGASPVAALSAIGSGSAVVGLGMVTAAPAVGGALAVSQLYAPPGLLQMENEDEELALSNARTAGYGASAATALAVPGYFALCGGSVYGAAAAIGFGIPLLGVSAMVVTPVAASLVAASAAYNLSKIQAPTKPY